MVENIQNFKTNFSKILGISELKSIRELLSDFSHMNSQNDLES